MPNIRQIENTADLRPNDRATSAAARAGQAEGDALRSIGREVGSGIEDLGQTYVRVKTQQDISHGLSVGSALTAANTANWQQTINQADPNDHTVGEKWIKEGLEPQLADYVSSFHTEEGRTWATQYTSTIRNHFSEKVQADQAIKAGQAAVENYQDTQRNLSNLALQDPSSMKMSLGLLDQTIDALVLNDDRLTSAQVANMRGALREQGREEIAKGAFIGTARNNPDLAMQQLQDGQFSGVFDATTQEQMFGFAESIKRSVASDARAAQADVKRQQQEVFEGRLAKITGQLFDPETGATKPPGPGYFKEIVELSTLPNADAAALRAAGDAGTRATEDALTGRFVRTNQAVWTDFVGRMSLPMGDPKTLTVPEVDRAYSIGALSKEDYSFLRRAAGKESDPVSKQAMSDLTDAMKAMKPLIDKSTVYSVNQVTADRYYQFTYDMTQKWQNLVKGGKTATEATAILADPRSPDGMRSQIGSYLVGNKEGLKALQRGVRPDGGFLSAPVAAPGTGRNPGESPEAYLKRTGG